MKKIAFICTTAAIICSCSQIAEIHVDDLNQATDLPDVIYASVLAESNQDSDTDPETRTYVQDDRRILWHNGDEISYFAKDTHNAKYRFDGIDGTASAEFTKVAGTGNLSSNVVKYTHAVYPYQAEAAYLRSEDKESVSVIYPEVQNYAPNSFGKGANIMYALGVNEGEADTDLYFRNACGYLIIKLYGTDVTVKNITLFSLDNNVKVAGPASICTFDPTEPVITMAEGAVSSVTLHCGEQGVQLSDSQNEPTEFWFALPPVTFNKGFKILVTPVQGAAYEMQTSKKVEITRNEIQPMAALEYTYNAPSLSQLHYTSTAKLEKFKVGENTHFDATITAHYYDERSAKYIIEFDSTLKIIKDDAFKNTEITSVSFPSHLNTIGKYAFNGTSLTELVIPGSVTLIDNYAFKSCASLKRLTFLKGDSDLKIIDGVPTMEGSRSDYGPFRESKLEYINVNRNILYKDSDGEGSAHVDYNDGLFKNSCTGITEVIIGSEVTTIIESMFTEVQMQKLIIPGNVNTIETNALYNCIYLEEIVFEPSASNTPLAMASGYWEGIAEESPFGETYTGSSNIKKVTLNREINYTLEDIDDDEGIFANKPYLTEVILGEQAKKLSKYMFSNCDALTSVTVPSTVTTMDDYVFNNCDRLKTVFLGATTIGKGVLYNCDGLTDLTIGGTVNTIGKDPFYDCDNLSKVTFEPSATGTSLTLGYQTYGTDDQGPFYDAPLSYIRLDREINYNYNNLDQWNEGVFANLHYDNSNLSTQVELGSSVKTILPYMFSGVRLTGLWIPTNVKSIGNYAFHDCRILEGVTLGHHTPPTLGTGVFDSCDIMWYISVPAGTADTYKSTEKWMDYNKDFYHEYK